MGHDESGGQARRRLIDIEQPTGAAAPSPDAAVDAVESRRPTLLRVLVKRRHWQTYETFVIQYERAAKELAERDQDPRLRGLSVGRRQFGRWLAATLQTKPYPSHCRVLEYLFGRPVDELFSPAPGAPEQPRVSALAAGELPDAGDVLATAEEWSAEDAALGEAVTAARRQAGRELAQHRRRVGLSQQDLANRVGYTRAHVAGAEAATNSTAAEFWRACDRVLGAGGALVAARGRIEAAQKARRDAAIRRDEATREARLQQWRREHGLSDAASENELPEREPGVHFTHEGTYPGTASPAPPEMGDMNRRELLRLFSMVGALLATAPVENQLDWERLDYFVGRPSRVDPATVDEYATLNTHLWCVFILSRSKHITFPLVREQLDVLVNSLQQSSGPAMYHRLCKLTSDLFQLAGEILFDGNHYTDAAQCYTLAATAGREGNAPDLWACALTRHAFIGVYERRFDQAASMLELAARLAKNGDSTLSTRHWVAAVQAQAFAGLGDFDACQRALDTAEQVQQLQGQIHNGGWLRFDRSRLAEERGRCYVELHRPDLAQAALTNALAEDLSARRRGGVLTDLAMLAIQRRDLGDAVRYVDAALDMTRRTNSGVIGRKLEGLQPYLDPFLGDRHVRDLSEQITTLTGSLAVR